MPTQHRTSTRSWRFDRAGAGPIHPIQTSRAFRPQEQHGHMQRAAELMRHGLEARAAFMKMRSCVCRVTRAVHRGPPGAAASSRLRALYGH